MPTRYEITNETKKPTRIAWCSSHDEPIWSYERGCSVGGGCEAIWIKEAANRCLGDCGRHTTARFEGGSHGPGPYCGWCQALPA